MGVPIVIPIPSGGSEPPAKGFVPTAWDTDGYVTEGTYYGTSVPDYFFEAAGFYMTMQKINFNSVVESIGYNAFNGLENYDPGALNDGLLSINDGAFRYTGPATVWIPDSCVTIGEAIFDCCPSALVIYCEAASRPAGWNVDWNWDNSSGGHFTVVWDTSYEDYIAL